MENHTGLNEDGLRFVSNLIIEKGPTNWPGRCLNELLQSSSFDWRIGLVDVHGQQVVGDGFNVSSEAWGIPISTCQRYCNADRIPYAHNFNFQTFAAAMTNYFLPWLALTAQLPYETGDPWSNVLSFCMAVGSPTLVTYSLTITILNRFWANKSFGSLRRRTEQPDINNRYAGFFQRIIAVQYLLQEAQQVPLMLSMEAGWLSSLLVLPANSAWWHTLRESLRATRRGVTASLVAQVMLAATAFLFTIIASFQAELGDPSTALQIASGSLWIWLIPIISGWVTVGTQHSHNTIRNALEAQHAARANPRSPIGNFVFTQPGLQRGLVVVDRTMNGLSPRVQLVQPIPTQHAPYPNQAQAFHALGPGHRGRLTWCGLTVAGDEQEEGPIYNYARLFTWCQVASTLHRTLETTADNIANDEICDAALRAQVLHIQNPPQAQGQQQPPPPPVVAPDDFTGDRVDTAVYCGLASRTQVLAYPEWHAMGTGDFPVYKHILGASAAALFLQWGTTGASILIAYKTPTAGFGCRSTGYLTYGAIGTAVWFFLLCSALFSHAVMLRYQRIHQATPQAHLTTVRRGLGLGLLCAAAVLTRVLGKFLAFANSIWLILSSLFEMTGAYSNCWCLGNYIGLGNRGWVLLFKSAPDLKVLAQPIWGGGIALTLGVCIGSYLIFVLAFMKNDRS
ncbi:hypothetical protein KC332_g1721 [Hortaea werneckii]|uniref:Uncharacterized protein n=2 Tax=Hortaea werneckii TaxID=91943 RepID=A0A3M7JDW2_HORWE|nr:hypothetical protein KC358_g7711 [Hortaea werneckii]KAI6834477.1 hypothetical protein KC342_g6246 [Hortaea werneckii]KAI6850040.1 hypothetical protein KC350_g2323 [Hortaea werneckii]KAI6941851.1 hypothetical protein KC341_g2609 [Hortaea werneckii]KAI6946711.1 hypothetical protein KC348_g2971 [Hortaea werneckii]